MPIVTEILPEDGSFPDGAHHHMVRVLMELYFVADNLMKECQATLETALGAVIEEQTDAEEQAEPTLVMENETLPEQTTMVMRARNRRRGKSPPKSNSDDQMELSCNKNKDSIA